MFLLFLTEVSATFPFNILIGDYLDVLRLSSDSVL